MCFDNYTTAVPYRWLLVPQKVTGVAPVPHFHETDCKYMYASLMAFSRLNTTPQPEDTFSFGEMSKALDEIASEDNTSTTRKGGRNYEFTPEQETALWRLFRQDPYHFVEGAKPQIAGQLGMSPTQVTVCTK